MSQVANGATLAISQLQLSWGGQYGTDTFADTAAHTAASAGTAYWTTGIAVGATVLTSSTDAAGTVASTHPTSLADGQAIRGQFTAITLSSGSIIMRRGPDA